MANLEEALLVGVGITGSQDVDERLAGEDGSTRRAGSAGGAADVA